MSPQVNPAVTVGVAIAREMPARDVVGYMVALLIGPLSPRRWYSSLPKVLPGAMTRSPRAWLPTATAPTPPAIMVC